MRFIRRDSELFESEDGSYVVWVQRKVRHGSRYEREWAARRKSGVDPTLPPEIIIDGCVSAGDAMEECRRDRENRSL